MLDNIKVAVIGTQGVPAHYGGFESMVENVIGFGPELGIEFTVFCSSPDLPSTSKPRLRSYKGATLKYVPLHANGIQSVAYDIVSMLRALRGYDALLILGVSGCMFMPALRLLTRGKRLVVNIDGLEHRRNKWGRLARWILRESEALTVRHADAIVADNKGIQDYVTETYGIHSELIAYGGDHVLREVSQEKQEAVLKYYGLQRGEYAAAVCRIEPENNCHVVLEAAARSGRPLLFVGNWEHCDYARDLRRKYNGVSQIHIVEAVYDLETLYALRANAGIYVHGHSAGGTNPSLVEAMWLGRPVAAFDVVYNRETTQGSAAYWKDEDDLTELLAGDREADWSAMGEKMEEIARAEYNWHRIASLYARLLR